MRLCRTGPCNLGSADLRSLVDLPLAELLEPKPPANSETKAYSCRKAKSGGAKHLRSQLRTRIVAAERRISTLLGSQGYLC